MNKKWLFGCGGCLVIFILLAVLFGACAMFIGGGDDNTSSNGSSKQSSNKTKEFKIGDTAKNGDIEVTVNSVETANQVGPSALPTTAKDTFVVADVTIKNNGNEALTIDSTMFKLLNGEKTAKADAGASTSANQSDDGTITDSFFLEQVNPDSTTQGKVVFDVSQDFANSDNKKMEITSKLFSTNKVTFKLSDEKTTTKSSKNKNNKVETTTEQVSNNYEQNNQSVESNEQASPEQNVADNNQPTTKQETPKQEGISKEEYDRTKTTTHDESQMSNPEYEQYKQAQQFTQELEQGKHQNGVGGGPGMTSPAGESFNDYQSRVQQERDALTVPE